MEVRVRNQTEAFYRSLKESGAHSKPPPLPDSSADYTERIKHWCSESSQYQEDLYDWEGFLAWRQSRSGAKLPPSEQPRGTSRLGLSADFIDFRQQQLKVDSTWVSCWQRLVRYYEQRAQECSSEKGLEFVLDTVAEGRKYVKLAQQTACLAATRLEQTKQDYESDLKPTDLRAEDMVIKEPSVQKLPPSPPESPSKSPQSLTKDHQKRTPGKTSKGIAKIKRQKPAKRIKNPTEAQTTKLLAAASSTSPSLSEPDRIEYTPNCSEPASSSILVEPDLPIHEAESASNTDLSKKQAEDPLQNTVTNPEIHPFPRNQCLRERPTDLALAKMSSSQIGLARGLARNKPSAHTSLRTCKPLHCSLQRLHLSTTQAILPTEAFPPPHQLRPHRPHHTVIDPMPRSSRNGQTRLSRPGHFSPLMQHPSEGAKDSKRRPQSRSTPCPSNPNLPTLHDHRSVHSPTAKFKEPSFDLASPPSSLWAMSITRHGLQGISCTVPILE